MSDERDWGAEAEREAEIRLPWSHSHRPLPRRVVRPLADFLQTEISSGILLLAAAAAALVWANSPWWETYVRFWHVTFTVRLGNLVIAQDLQHWINDALMTFFFLVVGLEIKRELTTGELRDPKRAVLPAIAALGGMVLPALIYLSLNAGGEGAAGWGIPIATDIAFALGVLTLAARGAPPGLKLFLLTLAIVDDIGAIVIITLFYSEGVAALPLLAAVGIVVAIVLLQRIHVRATAVYAVLGAGLWLALFESGIEAAIAGVVLALLTPAVPFQRPKAVSEEARRVADETVDDPRPPDADAASWLYLNRLTREAVSPIGRIEPGLHHNGKLVLGEAIGDLAGAKIAYRAFLKSLEGKPPAPTIDGFTPEQQFFIAWGQFRGDAIRPETQRLMIQGDPHPTGKYRVIGPLSNLPEFRKAFDCPADAPMVRPSEKRCEVW